MTQVRAKSTGYFGGIVRAPGDIFEVPVELWADQARRPSWAEAVDGGETSVADEPQVEAKVKSVKAATKKANTIDAPTAEPFADAPEPVAIAKGNGVKEALGIEADWVAPKPID